MSGRIERKYKPVRRALIQKTSSKTRARKHIPVRKRAEKSPAPELHPLNGGATLAFALNGECDARVDGLVESAIPSRVTVESENSKMWQASGLQGWVP
jgi:hypothetical protein